VKEVVVVAVVLFSNHIYEVVISSLDIYLSRMKRLMNDELERTRMEVTIAWYRILC
jgi:hypothetical protein